MYEQNVLFKKEFYNLFFYNILLQIYVPSNLIFLINNLDISHI